MRLSGWREFLKNIFTLQGFLRLLILILSIVLLVLISYSTFKYDDPFYRSEFNQRVEFWVCIIFLIDLGFEFFLVKNKTKYFLRYFLFFLVCIPYPTILPLIGWSPPREIVYMLRFAPLIRSAYALGIVVGWFTYRSSSRVFFTYLWILIVGVYIGSLAFYVFEYNVNPLVKTYGDALWWSTMEAVTVGSNIEAVTTIGKVLSVVVAMLGMLVIPMFTVYITNIVGAFATVSATVPPQGEIKIKSHKDQNVVVEVKTSPSQGDNTDSGTNTTETTVTVNNPQKENS